MQAWELPRTTFNWGQKTYIMGVLNVTPDSFSDGGQFNSLESAIAQANQMIEDGADILDIGGQSTRPNADEVSLQEELDRVIPVIEAIRQDVQIPISVDTTRSQVAREAIAAGADIINDISGAVFDSEMLSTVKKLGVPIILMHMRGTPKTMQSLTEYQDLIQEICDFLQERIESAIAHGIKQIMIDPGIGFAKKYAQNLEILRRLQAFQSLNCPILVGASRKGFIGHILDQPDPKKRVWGTAAACVSAIVNGADIVRVHDVAAMHDACRVADAIWR
ncbi:MAG: dihydropteroate synthase [Plectolyngbya sp. WJT66-NPBG17]|jgi:dihydropteroate synthase|nr:dihydropteroate synthase [Plectolyngbya sp. WJT66-NPBG17]MBW4527563.1 dihydropteroate synthase [Phormidium tanganyikae FI6-MK23]